MSVSESEGGVLVSVGESESVSESGRVSVSECGCE